MVFGDAFLATDSVSMTWQGTLATTIQRCQRWAMPQTWLTQLLTFFSTQPMVLATLVNADAAAIAAQHLQQSCAIPKAWQ